MSKFYIKKIGEHLQELGILALVFVPLDRALSAGKTLLLLGVCSAVIVAGIEMERRASNE